MSNDHAHLMSGLHGYMPNLNEVYATRREAIEGLKEFAREVRDDCDRSHYDQTMLMPAYCYSGKVRDGSIEFTDPWVHGAEYAEVTETCNVAACLAELEHVRPLL